MCHFVQLASPLTLSEVRAMLPAGLTADALAPSLLPRFRSLHPPAVTAITLLVGACSCDLVRTRHADPRDDEREHRARYRALGISRDRIVPALDRHRRGAAVLRPPAGWPGALARVVAEHARNAGPALYLAGFAVAPADVLPPPGVAAELTPLARVRESPDGWLHEDVPAIVTG